MEEPDLIQLFVRPLHEAGIAYLIAGSLGAMLYSEPRFTLDIDLPVLLEPKRLQLLPALFCEPAYYCPPLEVLTAETRRECRGHFNVIHVASGYKADFYPIGRDPFFGWAWQHRRRVAVGGAQADYAPAEYIILWKVVYFAEGGSEKHVRDIQRILEVAGSEIDHEVLREELHRRGLTQVYNQMQTR